MVYWLIGNMAFHEEIEALVNAFAYFKAYKVYNYCNEEYDKLVDEYNELVDENNKLIHELDMLKNKTCDYSKYLLEMDNIRLREQNKKYLEERDMYKQLYIKEKNRK